MPIELQDLQEGTDEFLHGLLECGIDQAVVVFTGWQFGLDHVDLGIPRDRWVRLWETGRKEFEKVYK